MRRRPRGARAPGSSLNSGLSLFLRGSYDFIGVSRHPLPRMPLRPPRFAYMVRDPEAIRQVLVSDAARYPKAELMDSMLRALTGYSIFVSNGEAWRRQRAIIDQAFENARVREVFGLMREACDALRDAPRSARSPPGGTISVDVDVETMHFAGDVIFRTLYSEPMSERDAHAIFEVVRAVPAHRLRARLSLARQRADLSAAVELARPARCGDHPARAEPADRAAAGADRARRDDAATTTFSRRSSRRADPVTGTRFDETELLDQVAMLFLAGHETSAAALGWSLYLIANRPDVQARMRAEVDAALGDRAPEFSDMRRLPFIRDVFQETLRLYPPVAFLARDAAAATELAGSRSRRMRRPSCRPGSCIATASIGRTPTSSIPTASPTPPRRPRAPAPFCRSAWGRASARARRSRCRRRRWRSPSWCGGSNSAPTPGHTPRAGVAADGALGERHAAAGHGDAAIADPLDLPFQLDAARLAHAPPHLLAERLDVGGASPRRG